ncbi:hypothetical protein LJB99_04290 [Deltaproteobacteria bacterium OttesenSCG-928-K17]|nr:hypothetical protein [Deltaproteobacteria bacterium OttesenSCG-928-K17]
MRNILVTIVGHDRPGIIHQVSKALADLNCTVVEVSQTTLMGEFAGHFSCHLPLDVKVEDFCELFDQALAGSGLARWITEAEFNPSGGKTVTETEPYVVTVRGKDRAGIIPGFSGAMAGFDVNIDNLRSVTFTEDGQAVEESGDKKVVLFFELSVPRAVNQRGLRQALSIIAEDMDLEMSLQHRDIFEAMHRV